MEEMPPIQSENQAPKLMVEMDMESPETPAEMLDSADVPEVSILEQENKWKRLFPKNRKFHLIKPQSDQGRPQQPMNR